MRPLQSNLILLAAALAFAAWATSPTVALAGTTLHRAPASLLGNGLVGYWSFDAKDMAKGNNGIITAYDKSGSGNHATSSSTVIPAVTIGRIGQALQFASSTNDTFTTMQTKHNSAIDDLSHKTISMWIYLTTWGTHIPGSGGGVSSLVVKNNWCGEVETWSVAALETNHSLWFNQGFLTQNGSWYASDDAISLNKWHHVVVAYDRTSDTNTPIMFIDGVRQSVGISSAPSGSARTDAGSGISMGSKGDCQSTNGKIDDVRIYNRLLSPDEIKRLYKIGATTKFGVAPNNLTNGLVGYWSFDGKDMAGITAYDRSGQGNNGGLINGPAKTVGKIGQALTFDGTNDYLGIGNVSVIDGATEASMCLWMKTSTTSITADAALVSKWDATGGWLIWVDDVAVNSGRTNTISFSTDSNGGTGGRVEGSTNLVTANTWDHYCGTFQGGTYLRLYKNGALDQENNTSIVSSVVANALPVNIANSNHATLIKYFPGLLDDVRIYNRALSTDEIKRLYKMGATAKFGVASNNGTLASGLVGYWSFDGKDMAGSDPLTAYDRSGEGNHATSTGTNIPTQAIGKLGQGLKFRSNSSNRLSMGNITALDFERTEAFSVSAWYRTEVAAPTTYHTIVAKQDGNVGPFRGWSLSIQGQLPGDVFRFWFCNDDSPSNQIVVDWTRPADTKWHHVLVTYDGSSNANGVRAYVNGAMQAASIINNTLTATTENSHPAQIGASNATLHMDGHLDDIRIYNRALSPDEIKRLYKMGR